MEKILIISTPVDTHALAARWGLLRQAITADLLCFSDYPQKLRSSFDLNARAFAFSSPEANGSSSDYSLVWNRRTAAVRPHPETALADCRFATLSGRIFLEGFRTQAKSAAQWINPRSAQAFIDNKINQLLLAEEIGFRVPRTIVSNDPLAVRRFHAGCVKCVAKSLMPFFWRKDKSTNPTPALTTVIETAQLENDLAIQSCPMIYQELVPKKFEYRVTVFGSHIVCVRIESQGHEDSKVDWRGVRGSRSVVTQVECPPALGALISTFMRRANLRISSFDFIVTPEDELVFVEVNEQGQFLWAEQSNPGIHLLDPLVAFLQSGSENFRYSAPARPLLLADYLDDKDGEFTLKQSMSRHVSLSFDDLEIVSTET